MADRGGAPRGGFGDRARGDRGRGRGRGRGRRGGKSEEKEWQPVTKLGRLVKAGKIKSMEEIYLHSLPVKEYQIVDFFLPKLKDEVMKVCWQCSLFQFYLGASARSSSHARKKTRRWKDMGIGSGGAHINSWLGGRKQLKELGERVPADGWIGFLHYNLELARNLLANLRFFFPPI